MFSSQHAFTNKDHKMSDEKENKLKKLMEVAMKAAEELCEETMDQLCKLPDNFMESESKIEGKNDGMMAMIMFGLFQMQLQSRCAQIGKIVDRKMGNRLKKEKSDH